MARVARRFTNPPTKSNPTNVQSSQVQTRRQTAAGRARTPSQLEHQPAPAGVSPRHSADDEAVEAGEGSRDGRDTHPARDTPPPAQPSVLQRMRVMRSQNQTVNPARCCSWRSSLDLLDSTVAGVRGALAGPDPVLVPGVEVEVIQLEDSSSEEEDEEEVVVVGERRPPQPHGDWQRHMELVRRQIVVEEWRRRPQPADVEVVDVHDDDMEEAEGGMGDVEGEDVADVVDDDVGMEEDSGSEDGDIEVIDIDADDEAPVAMDEEVEEQQQQGLQHMDDDVIVLDGDMIVEGEIVVDQAGQAAEAQAREAMLEQIQVASSPLPAGGAGGVAEIKEHMVVCHICMQLMHKPTALVPCGHLACRGCVFEWICNRDAPGTCSMCRVDATGEMLLPWMTEIVDEFAAKHPEMRRSVSDMNALDNRELRCVERVRRVLACPPSVMMRMMTVDGRGQPPPRVAMHRIAAPFPPLPPFTITHNGQQVPHATAPPGHMGNVMQGLGNRAAQIPAPAVNGRSGALNVSRNQVMARGRAAARAPPPPPSTH